MEKITSKSQMYAALLAGKFGNTIPCWFSVEDWEGVADFTKQWGVRTMTVGGPCRLFCPADEVRSTFESYLSMGHTPQISCMIDNYGDCVLMADVWDSPTGLIVHGIDMPEKDANWRRDMPGKARMYEGVAARRLLRRRLNENSYDDLMELLELYPDHDVELSAMSICFGTLPHRNTIIWECRYGNPHQGGRGY
jgi:hypothetical protein